MLVTPKGTLTDSMKVFRALNKLGYAHGIGRIDIVKNRYIGLKSRGCYGCKLPFLSTMSFM